MKEFKIYGGLEKNRMILLLHSGLRNDVDPEKFMFKKVFFFKKKMINHLNS